MGKRTRGKSIWDRGLSIPNPTDPPQRVEPAAWNSPPMLEIARRMGTDASEMRERLEVVAKVALLAKTTWPSAREMADNAFGVALDAYTLAHKLISLLPYSITSGESATKYGDLEDGAFKFPPGFTDGYPDPAPVIGVLLSMVGPWVKYASQKKLESNRDAKKPKNLPMRFAVGSLVATLRLEMVEKGIHPAIARRKLPTLVWLALKGAEVPMPGKTPAEQKKRLREQYFPKMKGAV